MQPRWRQQTSHRSSPKLRTSRASAKFVEQWKAKRLTSLTSESGWLTLAGLYWLKPGENTFGRAKGSALWLDNPSLAPEAGSFVLKR